MYFFDRLLKSLPLSGTDTLLQSALFLSSKAVEESFDELEILDSMSSSVMVIGLLRPDDSLLAPVVLPLDPNSFWVRDLPCDAKQIGRAHV